MRGLKKYLKTSTHFFTTKNTAFQEEDDHELEKKTRLKFRVFKKTVIIIQKQLIFLHTLT